MWNEPLPEGLRLDSRVWLSVEADLLPDGTFGRELLVVTDRSVKVVTFADGGPTVRLDLRLDEIEEPRAESFVGGGALEVSHNGARLEVVRYSAARVARFAAAAKMLERWLRGEEVEVPEPERDRCPRCGLPLEKGTTVCSVCAPKGRTLRRLLVYLRPYLHWVVLLSLLSIVSTGLGLLIPYLQKPVMDLVLAPPAPVPAMDYRLRVLGLVVLAAFGAQVLISGIGVAQAWLSSWVGNNITHDVRCLLYRHLQYLSLRFYDRREMGTVISRVNQDTGQLQAFLVWGSQDLALNILRLFGIGVLVFLINWRLALFILMPAPIVVLVSRTFWRRMRHLVHRMFHRWGRLNALLSETLNGLRVVKVFAQEPREISRFSQRSGDLAYTGVRVERVWSVLFSGISLLVALGTLLVWYLGARQVLGNVMTLGELVVFVTYVRMFYEPLRYLSRLLNWCSRSLTAAERVFEVLDNPPEVQDDPDAVAMPQIEGRVEFRNVTFGYLPHRPVLKNVSFAVEPGEMIGLVGHSGAGKTTTINLLCRFYEPDEGQILVDGVPLNKIRVEDLRRQLGVVPQDTFLFSGTIAENIAYAKPGASREEIIRAAKAANAHDFIIRKPDAYETYLGEKGGGLSAGERQRIAIARAVLHNPRILILDEATSQLDVQTEKQVQEAIARLVEGRTTFAIAHRLATLRNADRLLVLKNGEIVESGTHDELIKAGGEFSRLVKTYRQISKIRAVER